MRYCVTVGHVISRVYFIMLQAVNMVITRVPAIELSPVSVTSREHVLDAVPRVRNVKLATSVS